MTERILDFSEGAAYLHLRHDQLVVERKEEAGVTARTHRATVTGGLPAEGQVRLLAVTDRQFGKMENFLGQKRTSTEEPPKQLMLF